MAALGRTLLARAGVTLVLVTAAVALASPASADASGSFTVRAACPYQGEYSAGFYFTESFSGLIATPYSYKVVAWRDIDASNTFTMDPDTSGWYAESDGSHMAGPSYDYAYNGGPTHVVVAPGDTYHWQLIRTYGSTTVLIESDTVVQEATGCSTPPPPPQQTGSAPAPASFAASPHKVKVDHHGKFAYSFGAAAGVPGTIVVSHGGTVWAHGTFVVPGAGTEAAGLKLSKKARHYLAAHRKTTATVTVVLSNAYGSTSSGTSLKLRWA